MFRFHVRKEFSCMEQFGKDVYLKDRLHSLGRDELKGAVAVSETLLEVAYRCHSLGELFCVHKTAYEYGIFSSKLDVDRYGIVRADSMHGIQKKDIYLGGIDSIWHNNIPFFENNRLSSLDVYYRVLKQYRGFLTSNLRELRQEVHKALLEEERENSFSFPGSLFHRRVYPRRPRGYVDVRLGDCTQEGFIKAYCSALGRSIIDLDILRMQRTPLEMFRAYSEKRLVEEFSIAPEIPGRRPSFILKDGEFQESYRLLSVRPDEGNIILKCSSCADSDDVSLKVIYNSAEGMVLSACMVREDESLLPIPSSKFEDVNMESVLSEFCTLLQGQFDMEELKDRRTVGSGIKLDFPLHGKDLCLDDVRIFFPDETGRMPDRTDLAENGNVFSVYGEFVYEVDGNQIEVSENTVHRVETTPEGDKVSECFLRGNSYGEARQGYSLVYRDDGTSELKKYGMDPCSDNEYCSNTIYFFADGTLDKVRTGDESLWGDFELTPDVVFSESREAAMKSRHSLKR